MFRVGIGYDVHAFAPKRRLVLGGVEVLFELGLAGHSDADVLLHAVTDALLGAAALGDIGTHFPDGDPQYKDTDSGVLLSKTVDLLSGKGFSIGNIDATVIADRPKLNTYTARMRENISRLCRIPVENVSVKATTEEGLGLAGRGIGANCIVCIQAE